MSATPTIDPTLARQIARELALPIVEELLQPLADLVADRLGAALTEDGSAVVHNAPRAVSAPGSVPPAQSDGMPRLVDAATLAKALGVSRDCVYDHASDLGGRRLGKGPKARLRFDLDAALEAWTSRPYGSESQPPAARATPERKPSKRRRRLDSDADLLPIRPSTTYPRSLGNGS